MRKWTSKLDLFQKKYIVVPINEKWVTKSAQDCSLVDTLNPQFSLVSGHHMQSRIRSSTAPSKGNGANAHDSEEEA